MPYFFDFASDATPDDLMGRGFGRRRRMKRKRAAAATYADAGDAIIYGAASGFDAARGFSLEPLESSGLNAADALEAKREEIYNRLRAAKEQRTARQARAAAKPLGSSKKRRMRKRKRRLLKRRRK